MMDMGPVNERRLSEKLYAASSRLRNISVLFWENVIYKGD